MKHLSVPVSDELDETIRKRMAAGGFGSMAEYLRHTVRQDLERADEARAGVARMKYAPHGARAVAAGIADDRWGARPLAETMAAANARAVYFAKVETVRGVEAVEEIAALDGVDGLWIGHGDLSVSLGLPPAYDQDAAEFVSAIASVEAACKRHGVIAGVFAGNATVAGKRIEQGFRLLEVADDGRTMVTGATAALAQLRERL